MRLLTLILALLLVWVTGTPASAHASLVSAEPADGALLKAPPPRFTLTFSEPISPLVALLVDPAGATIRLEGARAEGNNLIVDCPADLQIGTHILSWRVISADSHPVGGTVVFSVGQPMTGAKPIEVVRSETLALSLWLSRLAIYTGLFFGIGGVFFRSWIGATPGAHDPLWHATAIAIAIGILGCIASVWLQGLDVLDAPLGGNLECRHMASRLADDACDHGVDCSGGPFLLGHRAACALRICTPAPPLPDRPCWRRTCPGRQRSREQRLAPMADAASRVRARGSHCILGRRLGTIGPCTLARRR